MSDKTRFYKMTRPVKFRRLKLIFKSIGLTYEVGKERIKYLFNYLLYKLNILKRYSYRTNTEQVYPLEHYLKLKHIQTGNFAGTAIMNLVLVSDIDIDYFYREKDGAKKVTYVVKNNEKFSLFSSTILKDIAINVNGKYHLIDHLPTLKVALAPPKTTFGEAPNEPTKLKYKTVTYDTRILKQLCHKNLLGVDMKPEDISEPMAKYYYEYSCYEIERFLGDILLSSLVMEVKE